MQLELMCLLVLAVAFDATKTDQQIIQLDPEKASEVRSSNHLAKAPWMQKAGPCSAEALHADGRDGTPLAHAGHRKDKVGHETEDSVGKRTDVAKKNRNKWYKKYAIRSYLMFGKRAETEKGKKKRGRTRLANKVSGIPMSRKKSVDPDSEIDIEKGSHKGSQASAMSQFGNKRFMIPSLWFEKSSQESKDAIDQEESKKVMKRLTPEHVGHIHKWIEVSQKGVTPSRMELLNREAGVNNYPRESKRFMPPTMWYVKSKDGNRHDERSKEKTDFRPSMHIIQHKKTKNIKNLIWTKREMQTET